MMNDFMTAMIERDFNVRLVQTGDGWSLFVAKNAEIWHFVCAAGEGQQLHIEQFHIPRWILAKAYSVFPYERDPQGENLWSEIGFGAYIAIQPSGEHLIALNMVGFSLPDSLVAQIRADQVLIGELDKGTVEVGGRVQLPGATTYKHNPVIHGQKDLISAIAFEGNIRGGLDPGKFGLYSAFCTLVDFPQSTQIPRSTLRESLEGQFTYFTPDGVPDDVMAGILTTQRQLLGKEIWGPGISSISEDAVNTLDHGVARLSDAQRCQFTLLSGMYNAGLMVVLSTIVGAISFARYAELKAEPYQPDSDEEQTLRMDLSTIALLGQLADNRTLF